MIRLKLESYKNQSVILKMYISKKDKENVLVRRVLMESTPIKNAKSLIYIVPMKYFLPLYNNLGEELVKIHENSLTTFFEYSDEYDENFRYCSKVTPKFMREWRELGCPKVYKININKDENSFDKIVVFQKNNICNWN